VESGWGWGGGGWEGEMKARGGAAPEPPPRVRNPDAIARLRRALLLAPFHPAALAELAQHARATGDWMRLSLLQARRFSIADSESERAGLALELASSRPPELY